MKTCTKTCRRCRKDKPLGEFDNDKSRPDGRRPYCKNCARAAKLLSQMRSAVAAMRARLEAYEQEIARLEAGGEFVPKDERLRRRVESFKERRRHGT